MSGFAGLLRPHARDFRPRAAAISPSRHPERRDGELGRGGAQDSDQPAPLHHHAETRTDDDAELPGKPEAAAEDAEFNPFLTEADAAAAAAGKGGDGEGDEG